MAETMYGLGGRLALLDPGDLSSKAQLLYDEILAGVVPAANKAGFRSMDEEKHLIGPFNATLYSPEMCGSFLALQKAEAKHTTLTTRTRQVVILSVGSVWKAAYELYAHAAVAKAAGITPQQVEALAVGQQPERLTADEKLAQAFTLELVSTHAVSSHTYAAARESFGDRGLVKMVTLIGCYLSVCALLNAFQIPAPETPHKQEVNHDSYASGNT